MSKFRDWRLAQKLTLEQVAERLQTGANTVSRYERGERMPGQEAMVKIVEITGGEVMPNDFYDLAGARGSEAA